MNKLIALVGLALVVSSPVFAGDQQEKMKGCNREAKDGGMKGDERKAFMSKCLKKDYVLKRDAMAGAPAAAATPATPATPAASSAQQDKMKACNADAKGKGLKGEERKTFMSSCLKG